MSPHNKKDVALALVAFSLSSIGMMTGNKVATNHLPLPATLVILQAVTACPPLLINPEVVGLQPGLCVKWAPVAFLFAASLFTSMLSFLYCSVSTILILRNTAPVLSTGVEYCVRGKKANFRIIASELTIVLGCFIYSSGQIGINNLGMFWILVNIVIQVAYGNLVKVYLSTLRDETGEELSKYTCAYYNNVLSLPFFVVGFFLCGEHSSAPERVAAVTPWGWATVAFTCACGYWLGVSGFGLQRFVSATSFLVVNNMVKIVNLLLGMAFMDDRFSNQSAAAGCFLSLGAGVWYSYEQNKLTAREHEEARKAMAASTADIEKLTPTNASLTLHPSAYHPPSTQAPVHP